MGSVPHKEILRKGLAEALATYVLVFAGTGAVVVDDVAGGITHVGVALAFGVVVMAMIYALGDLSGAHMNPAVTLAFAASRRLKAALVLPYLGAQFLGAILASLTLHGLFPAHETLGWTVPSGAIGQTFVLEVILTAILMFVVLCVSTGSKEQGLMAGIAVGGTVGLLALVGGPISGASMNPARSLGPALVVGDLSQLWIYLTAPPLGALLACLLWWPLRPISRPHPAPDPHLPETTLKPRPRSGAKVPQQAP